MHQPCCGRCTRCHLAFRRARPWPLWASRAAASPRWRAWSPWRKHPARAVWRFKACKCLAPKDPRWHMRGARCKWCSKTPMAHSTRDSASGKFWKRRCKSIRILRRPIGAVWSHRCSSALDCAQKRPSAIRICSPAVSANALPLRGP